MNINMWALENEENILRVEILYQYLGLRPDLYFQHREKDYINTEQVL